MLLEAADLGSGWTQEPEEADNEESPCDVDSDDMTITGQATTRSFTSGQATSVISDATVFETEEQASEAFSRLVGEDSTRCFADELSKEIAGGGEEVSVGDVQIDQLAPADAGDEDAAFRLTMPLEAQGATLDLFLDIRAVRAGRGVGLVAFTQPQQPFDEAVEQELVEAVAAGGAG
jgi:hypothetical protein